MSITLPVGPPPPAPMSGFVRRASSLHLVPEMTIPTAAVSSRADVDKVRLLHHVVMELRVVLGEFPDLQTDAARAVVALDLLDSLLADDSPTPQLSRGPEDALTIEWLVDGNRLIMDVYSATEIHLWAVDQAGMEIFDYDVNANWGSADPAIVAARRYLAVLAGGVRHRVQLRLS